MTSPAAPRLSVTKGLMVNLAMTTLFVSPVVVYVKPGWTSVILGVNFLLLLVTYMVPPYGSKRYHWYSDEAHFKTRFPKRSSWLLFSAAVLLASCNVHYVLFQATPRLVANPWPWSVVKVAFDVAMGAVYLRAGFPGPDSVVGGGPLKIDVYAASGPSACVYFHGGAFVLGSRRLGAAPLSFLAKRGIVGFAPAYRLTSNFQGAGLQGAVDDAVAAVTWVKKNAKTYGVDPNKIFLAGDSAGGLLAMAAAMEVPGVAAVVLNWPVLTVTGPSWFDADDDPAQSAFFASSYWGKKATIMPGAAAATYVAEEVLAGTFLLYGRQRNGWLPAAYDEALGTALSPLLTVKKKKKRGPPLLVAAALNDSIVPFSQPHRFAKAYRGDATLLAFDGAGHGQGAYLAEPGRQALLAFLAKHNLFRPHATSLSNVSDTALDLLAAVVGGDDHEKTNFSAVKAPHVFKKKNVKIHLRPSETTPPKVTSLSSTLWFW